MAETKRSRKQWRKIWEHNALTLVKRYKGTPSGLGAFPGLEEKIASCRSRMEMGVHFVAATRVIMPSTPTEMQ